MSAIQILLCSVSKFVYLKLRLEVEWFSGLIQNNLRSRSDSRNESAEFMKNDSAEKKYYLSFNRLFGPLQFYSRKF